MLFFSTDIFSLSAKFTQTSPVFTWRTSAHPPSSTFQAYLHKDRMNVHRTEPSLHTHFFASSLSFSLEDEQIDVKTEEQKGLAWAWGWAYIGRAGRVDCVPLLKLLLPCLRSSLPGHLGLCSCSQPMATHNDSRNCVGRTRKNGSLSCFWGTQGLHPHSRPALGLYVFSLWCHTALCFTHSAFPGVREASPQEGESGNKVGTSFSLGGREGIVQRSRKEADYPGSFLLLLAGWPLLSHSFSISSSVR